MAKHIKIVNAVLCEYATQSGGSNKATLVGVYSGDIIASSLPANLPFGFYAELPPGQNFQQATMELRIDGKTVLRAELSIPETPREGSTIIVPQVIVPIPGDCVFEAVLIANGFAKTVLLTKKITKGVIPSAATALPPPSSQSPPGAPAS